MGYLELPRALLRQPAARWLLRAILDAGLGQPGLVAWLRPLLPELAALYPHHHEPAGYGSVGLVLYPLAEASPMQENLVEALWLQIHLLWRCWQW